jgi:hypothetical protein
MKVWVKRDKGEGNTGCIKGGKMGREEGLYY